MPELPEVELARRSLLHWIAQAPLKRVWASAGTPLRGVTPDRVVSALQGRRTLGVERIGKHLLWKLDGGVAVHLHLGMTGKLVLRRSGAEPPRHERVGFEVAGHTVHFVDPRRFGRFELVSAGRLRDLPDGKELGPDALEEPLSPKALAARVGSTRRPLKVALMDQELIAGLGNIQVAEILFRARLSPSRAPAKLTPAEWKRLATAIQASLRQTLREEHPGPGEDIAYVEEPGSANPFKVYGHAGEPCPRCGTKIKRSVQAQRSTFYCPHCQK
jgi:formamidopyrimidine-DNA glycosylase